MALPLLAVALIVRDEASRLPGCLAALESLGPLVDHVVVHDTGSCDGTRDLARAAGARLIEGTWDGDFARARNVALDAAPARWVLMVDADERVEADPARLRALLEASGDVAGIVVPLVNLGPDGAEQYTAPIVRLVRPDRARFTGRLHEHPVARDGNVPLPLAQVPRDVLLLRHLGYADPAEVRRKAERNLLLAHDQVSGARAAALAAPGGEREVAALARALYHRGRTLLSAGWTGDAAVDLEELRALGTSAAERLWGMDVLAQLRLALGQAEEVDELTGQLRELGADPRYCAWLQARVLLGQERFAEALVLLRTVDQVIDTVGRDHDLTPVLEAQMLAAGRSGAVDEAAACCIRLMAGLGRTDGLGPLLLTLWGTRPAAWLVQLLSEADRGHRAAVVSELASCPDPGPAIAAALAG